MKPRLQVGLREAPVIVVAGLSEPEKRALAVADNKIARECWLGLENGLPKNWANWAKLLPECNLDLDITGFETAEIDNLLGDLVDPEVDPADAVPPPKRTAISKIGDLWARCGFSAHKAPNVGGGPGVDAQQPVIVELRPA